MKREKNLKQSKELQAMIQELKISNERYKIIIEQLGSTIFEYNVADGSVSYSANFSRIFGSETPAECFPQSVLERCIVHPEDVEDFRQLFEKIQNGAVHAEDEFRLKNNQKSYFWYKIKLTAICNEGGQPLKAVGQISDITCEKQEMQDLMQKAQHDELTGLLNKAATQRFVEKSLTGSAACALYIIDIDRFKNINDNLGHMFGDSVLAEVGGCLKRLFRSSDIVGRIGGDEFMVLLKDIGDPSLIYEKAQALNECLNQTFCGQSDDYTISGSIGIAIYPKDGTTYCELFKKADTALYIAKRSGGNNYVVCNNELFNKDPAPAPNSKRKHHPVLYTVPKCRDFNDNVFSYVFDLLFHAKDISNVINIVLKLLGERFHLSHVYIYENPGNDFYANINCDWYSNDACANYDNPYKTIYSNFLERFVDGVFFCDDVELLEDSYRVILKMQGIRSILQYAILEDGKFAGCIGFDECNESRLWLQEDIDFLSAISEMIGIFVTKKRASNQLKLAYESAGIILNTSDSFAYVIDRDTYRILYSNKKIPPAASDPGKRCYTVFGNGITPCADCPLNSDNPIEYPRYGIRARATASKIHWSGSSNAVLIFCHEIDKDQPDC